MAWNCCSGGARKWVWVDQLDPDVAVICEGPQHSPRPEATLFDPPVAWHAVGGSAHKQVAIGSSRHHLRPLEPREGQGQWAAAASVDGGPDILGIWSRPPTPGTANYADSVIATLTVWADRLAEGRMVVAGDFNVGFPTGRDRLVRPARRLVRAWEALGLVSAYHHYFDAGMGDESRPTFFDERRRQLGWHIDYVLVHQDLAHRIRNVELGDHREWVASKRSDHVPIIVDLDW